MIPFLEDMLEKNSKQLESRPIEAAYATDRVQPRPSKKKLTNKQLAENKELRLMEIKNRGINLDFFTVEKAEKRSGRRAETESTIVSCHCTTKNRNGERDQKFEQWKAANLEKVFDLFHPPKARQPLKFSGYDLHMFQKVTLLLARL